MGNNVSTSSMFTDALIRDILENTVKFVCYKSECMGEGNSVDYKRIVTHYADQYSEADYTHISDTIGDMDNSLRIFFSMYNALWKDKQYRTIAYAKSIEYVSKLTGINMDRKLIQMSGAYEDVVLNAIKTYDGQYERRHQDDIIHLATHAYTILQIM